MGAGSRAASSVPLLMLLALVVSVVADATKPLVCDVGIVGKSRGKGRGEDCGRLEWRTLWRGNGA